MRKCVDLRMFHFHVKTAEQILINLDEIYRTPETVIDSKGKTRQEFYILKVHIIHTHKSDNNSIYVLKTEDKRSRRVEPNV